ncbi:MAG: RAD55 family ATPase [Methanosarcinales archaeon]
MRKKRLNTTFSEEAYKILVKYQKELGSKSRVLEAALKNMDQTRYKGKLGINKYEKIVTRKSTGIEGLDKMIEGGFPENFIVIVSGPPGTGKTTFAMQFLIYGINNNEKCIYFSSEEDAEQLYNHCLRFGWDLSEYVDQGLLELFGFTMIPIDEILNIIKLSKPTRLVFDSVNVFYNLPSDKKRIRRDAMLRNIIKLIKKERITTLMITEKTHGLEKKCFDEFDFMGDGLIFMDRLVDRDMDTFIIAIQKMRGTIIDAQPKVFEITKEGIQVYPDANLFEYSVKDIRHLLYRE